MELAEILKHFTQQNYVSLGCEARGMELGDEWDDEEQQLVIVVNTNTQDSSGVIITDPLAPEMVAVTTEMAGAETPAQGSTTPRSVATSDHTAREPEMVSIPATSSSGQVNQSADISKGLSIETIRASLDDMLSAPGGNLGTPDVNTSQNLWGNFDMGSVPFLPAPNGSNDLTPATSMLAPIFSTLSEQERNKMTTDLIINCIRQQKILWDSTHPNFGDSKLCPLLWSNIASVCGFNVKKLKRKWYALKCTYKKEYIKCITKGVTSKSSNFTTMSFLEEEIQSELAREHDDENVAMTQVLRWDGAIDRHVAESSVVHNLEDDDDDDEDKTDPGDDDDDDCVIVESVKKLTVQDASQSRKTDPLATQPTSSKSNPGTPSLQTAPKPLMTIRAKKLSELQDKRPPGSGSSQGSESSTVNEKKLSPEVICLGESKDSQETAKKQYMAVPGKPVIKFKPSIKQSAQQPLRITVEDGMPKKWNEANSYLESQSPAVIKEYARKSTSGANSRLGVKNAITAPGNSNPVKTNNTVLPPESRLKPVKLSSVNSEEEMQWKIGNPRTIEAVHVPVRQHRTEPTTESSKPASNNTSTTEILPKPEPMEDDEIQIIREVPSTSAQKGTTNPPQTETKKRETSQDPPAPSKRRRLSNVADAGPSKVAPKKKVDKTRENSANEHFLLSLLYDVENMSNDQFRRLKKHSTSLASMILDNR